MPTFVNACVPPLVFGYCVVSILGRSLASIRTVYWSAIVATGLGLDALLFFWFRRAFLTVEWVVVCIGVLLLLNRAPQAEKHDFTVANSSWIVRVMFAIAFIVGTLDFIRLASEAPHGGWDAWALWNLHARVLVRAGPIWLSKLASTKFSHPDYPLLLPSITARFWRVVGAETTLVPIAIAFVFMTLTVAVLFGTLRALRSEMFAATAAITLIGTPFFVLHAVEQYADVPFGFLTLLTIALLCLYEEKQEEFGILILAGFCAGLAGWLKNEGLLFLVILPVGYILALQPCDVRQLWGRLRWLSVGAAPALATIVYFKTVLAVTDILLRGQTFRSFLSRADDIERHGQIIGYFFVEMWKFGEWFLSPLPLILLSLLVARFGPWPSVSRSSRLAFVVLALMVSGYYFVYVLTPIPLLDHLQSSLNRLLLQLWPMFLLATFLMLGEKAGPPNRMQWHLIPILSMLCVAAVVVARTHDAEPPTRITAEMEVTFPERSLEVGYYVVSPDKGSAPKAFNRLMSLQEHTTATIPQPPLATGADFELKGIPLRHLGLSLVNADTAQQSVIGVMLKDDAGRDIGQTSLQLGPGFQISRFLSELFPALNSVSGSRLYLQSSHPFAALVLRFEKSTFVPMLPHVRQPAEGPSIFPQFISYGGWMTELMLSNTLPATATGKLLFFNSEHRPWPVQLNGMERASFKYSMAPLGSLRLSPYGK